jgi:hypothetical protein
MREFQLGIRPQRVRHVLRGEAGKAPDRSSGNAVGEGISRGVGQVGVRPDLQQTKTNQDEKISMPAAHMHACALGALTHVHLHSSTGSFLI